MKIGSLLVILAVVLAVLGAGLSYSGYNESLRVSTLTSTQSYTSTSTKTIASTRTETSVITSSSIVSILDQVIDIRGIEGTIYCGYYDSVSSSIDAGMVNVSFNSDGGRVSFWMLTEDSYRQWTARRSEGCQINAVSKMYKPDSVSYESTTNIPATATYYFVFLNENNDPVSITLHVDGGMHTEVLTTTREQVDYLTQATPFVTETVSFSTHPVGLGLLFYSGIGLIIVAGIVLAVSRMKGAAPRTVQPSKPQPAPPVSMPAQGQTEDTRYVQYLAKLDELRNRGEISREIYQKLKDDYWSKLEGARLPASSPVQPPEAEPPVGKFCIDCAAPLPAHATFCNKCGTKQ